MKETDNRTVLTREQLEKELKNKKVKNPASNSGCLFVFGSVIIIVALWFLFVVLFSDENNKHIIVALLISSILVGCWPLVRAIKSYKYFKRNKKLLEGNNYRIVKSNCVKINKKLIAEETGPDNYVYSCDLENGKYAIFVLDEISQKENGDPVDIGTAVYTVYLDLVPSLYYSEKEYVISPELFVEEQLSPSNVFE